MSWEQGLTQPLTDQGTFLSTQIQQAELGAGSRAHRQAQVGQSSEPGPAAIQGTWPEATKDGAEVTAVVLVGVHPEGKDTAGDT